MLEAKASIRGRIQSIQSFSTLDGPGTRSVVFLQGCHVGCVFCHNPDSWDMSGGEEISTDDLLRRLERYRPFLTAPGLTVSGGEPLCQPEFALDLIALAKAEGWHTALDTSGCVPVEIFRKVAAMADLVIFSIKHPLHPERLAPGCRPDEVAANLRNLAEIPVPVWLRYVLINGRTDEPEALAALGRMAANQPRLKRLEILPYNSLAAGKWTQLGWDPPFGTGPKPLVDEDCIERAEATAAEAMRGVKAGIDR